MSRIEEIPVLYSFRRCPYAMRARLALQAAAIECQLREVVLRDKPLALLKASPKGTVPVLVLPGGQVIDESLAIAQWALQKHDPFDWLEPETDTIGEMMALIGEADGDFKFHLDRYKYAWRFEEGTAKEHRVMAVGFLMSLEERLSQGAWLCGGRQSLADVAIAPFIRQFANTDKIWFQEQPWPHLIVWLTQFLASESFVSIMDKYSPWREGDEPVFFPQNE